MLTIAFSVAAVLLLFVIGLTITSRFKMCPPDKILVVYGSVKGGAASKCYNGGSTFVFPIFQSYGYLDLAPLSIDVQLNNALSSQNIRVSAPANFTVAISNSPEVMGNAATRLLGKDPKEIAHLAREIITGQMRQALATMTIEQINSDRDKLVRIITESVETELNKIGLHLLNVNITDIRDESGYIEALGKEAAAKAINDAQIRVAEENQRGATGKAVAERDQAVRVAAANAEAIVGENTAKQRIAESQAELAIKKAEADKRAQIAQKTAIAATERAELEAQRETEQARLTRDEAAQKADLVAKANAMKDKVRVEAEAKAVEAETLAKGEANAARIEAEGRAAAIEITAKAEASAVALRAKAEAEGKEAVLLAQAKGLKEFEDAKDAVQLIIAQQFVQIAQVQAGAIQGLKMDKVVLMGGGNGGGGPGQFVQDLFKGVLPLHQVAESTGISLPTFLGAAAAHHAAAAAPKVNGTAPATDGHAAETAATRS